MARIDNDELLAAIESHRTASYDSAQGYRGGNLSDQRTDALEAYLGLNTNPAPEGRSQVVDRSCYETVHTILPSLTRIFAQSSEEVCRCVPLGPGDEQAADQMTALLNHVVTQRNPWEQICNDWIHDALVLANSYAMATWREDATRVRERYEGQSDEQLALIMQDRAVTVIGHTARVDEQATRDAQEGYAQAMAQWQQAAPILQAQGAPIPPQPQPPQPVMVHDIELERSESEGRIAIEVLPPEHCSVDIDCPDWMLRGSDYFEFRRETTIAALRAMGLDVPEDIADDEMIAVSEDTPRDRFGEDRTSGTEPGVLRRVVARMVWVRADCEGDGVARLYYCIVVGREILFVEPAARINVSSMTPQPLPHRHHGMSLVETVRDIQDIRTAITRGGLDSLYLANQGRHAISSRVSLADMLASRPGGVVRMLDDSLPGEGHILPLTHPVVFDQSIGALQYFDEVRQARSGAWKQFAGTDADVINKTASGLAQQQSFAAMRTEHIARMMAPAVEYLFECVQELIQKHQNNPLTLKLRGQWTVIDPQAWRKKREIRISVGVGAGNKEAQYAQLESIYQKQLAGLQLGLAGREEIHATVVEQAKLAGFADPNKFWSDTQKPAPQQPPPPEVINAQTAVQLKQMELQADAQRFQAQTQLELEKIRMQAEANRQAKASELTVQATNDQRDAQREQDRLAIEAQLKQRDLEMEAWKARLEAETKVLVAQMSAKDAAPADASAQQEALALAINGFAAALSSMQAPRTAVKTTDGRWIVQPMPPQAQ